MRITYKTTFIIHTKEFIMIPWFFWPEKKKKQERQKKTFKQHGSWQEMDLFFFSFFRVWYVFLTGSLKRIFDILKVILL